jgi:hypothetical protein
MSPTPLFIPSNSSASPAKSLAYQQTRAEYESNRSGVSEFIHRELVRVALAAHRFVPVNVLAEYPDLLRQQSHHSLFSRATD